MKNINLNQWLWKWHFIAGLISLPFVLVLAITGTIYLFQPDVDSKKVEELQTLQTKNTSSNITYQAQYDIAKKALNKPPNTLILNTSDNQANEFVIGRFSNKKSVYVNPYSGEVQGQFSPKDSWMYTIRKLHGELLGGKVGTKLVELIASWLVVLVLTGIYIWFPFKKGQIKGFFTIRMKQGKRIFFRDLHAVTGFWISIILLITLAGGLPWTDVFGGGFKAVQKMTNTGYPDSWRGIGLSSSPRGEALTVDQMVDIAKSLDLKGIVSIGLPRSPKSTFSVSNRTFDLGKQRMVHFDQYSGKLIKDHTWSDVGFLMRGRMWVMAFHQGQFGSWNWWLMFIFSILLAIMTLAAIISYLLRKPRNKWGVPRVPAQFKVGQAIVALIILLGLILPMFGISLLLLFGYSMIRSRQKRAA